MDRQTILLKSGARIRELGNSRKGAMLLILAGIAYVVLVSAVDRKYLWDFPDFGSIEDPEARQVIFFRYMDPLIRRANAEVMSQRKVVLRLNRHLRNGYLNRREDRWLRKLGQVYGLHFARREPLGERHVLSLLKRLDMVPYSMVLAQATIETGWGTSYLAREGNNMFGMMSYEPEFGIILANQSSGTSHAFMRYRTPGESLKDYLRNLNSNLAYGEMREIRSRLRKKSHVLDGLTVASGLSRYSEEGWDYVDKVQLFIRIHNLGIHDKVQN